jgi:hypothetical protein
MPKTGYVVCVVKTLGLLIISNIHGVNQVTMIWTTILSWLSMDYVEECLASSFMAPYIRRWTSRVDADNAKELLDKMLNKREFIWHGVHDIGSKLPFKARPFRCMIDMLLYYLISQ